MVKKGTYLNFLTSNSKKMLEAIQATIYKQILSNRPIELKKILLTTLILGQNFFFQSNHQT